MLDSLGEKYKLLMVGAGMCSRIFRQMNGYPIDIIGNYGMQFCTYNAETKALDKVFDMHAPCDRESVERRITALRERFGYTEYTGDNVEYHDSGCVKRVIFIVRKRREVSLKSDSYGANSSVVNWIDFDNDKVYVEVWGSGDHEIVLRETFYSKKGKVLHYKDYSFTARLRIASFAESNVVLTPFSGKNSSSATVKLELKHTKGDVTWTSTKPEVATLMRLLWL